MAKRRREKRERALAAAGEPSDNPEQSDKLPPRKKRKIANDDETTESKPSNTVAPDDIMSVHPTGEQSSSTTQTGGKAPENIKKKEKTKSASQIADKARTKKTRKAPKPTS
jgi:hypothetical protein